MAAGLLIHRKPWSVVPSMRMSGAPGAGKTLLARSGPPVLPRLTFDEALDVARIHSVAGLLPGDTPLMRHRPFRAPHHPISQPGLVGGGRWPRPGEISMAHRGVLFLDELPEFGTRSLETLRQPLEDHAVVISRAAGTLSLPANFVLIGAMNPCPCGYAGDPTHECTCSKRVIGRHQKRIPSMGSGRAPDRCWTVSTSAPGRHRSGSRSYRMTDGAGTSRRSSLSKERPWAMCSAIRRCEAHVSEPTRGEEKDVLTGAPGGHSAPSLVVDCVSIH